MGACRSLVGLLWSTALALRLLRLPHLLCLCLCLCLIPNIECLDNGLAITPPKGWRSWNAFDCTTPDRILTEYAMLAAMAGLTDRTRKIGSDFASLLDIGFDSVSMDDGWQQCNCSTRQDLDPSLPNCSVGQCMGGFCSWHDPNSGRPMVNKHRFNNMSLLVRAGQDAGLKVGGYLNNCICMEAGSNTPRYHADAEWLLDQGFDGVKVDSCGNSKNVSEFAQLFNASGKAILIENCHNGVPDPATGSCPMNFFRSGGDIAATFPDILGEIYSTISYNDRPDPLSRPGCWAYPDMLEVGNFEGIEPLRSNEERSHFALWCITSSPLILGMNFQHKSDVDRVWPFITNRQALAVNEAWSGEPGTLVTSFPASAVEVFQIGQTSCSGKQTLGWKLENGKLFAPLQEKSRIEQVEDAFCVDGSSPLPYEPQVYANPCPPPTSRSRQVHCGLPIRPCSQVKGTWDYDVDRRFLSWRLKVSDKPSCLQVLMQEIQQISQVTLEAASRATQKVKHPEWRVGDGVRRPALTQLAQCPESQPSASSGFQFEFSGGLLKVRNQQNLDMCLSSVPLNGVQLWAKRLSATKAALLFVNVLSTQQQVEQRLDLLRQLVEGNSSSGSGSRSHSQLQQTEHRVENVWTKELQHVHDDWTFSEVLEPHADVFLIVDWGSGPASSQALPPRSGPLSPASPTISGMSREYLGHNSRIIEI